MEKYNNGRRQILMALASLAGGLFLPGTGHAAPQTQEAQRMLVVFYSHTGNTRTIARHIQALTGCDLLDLEPVTPYPRDYDTVVSQAKKEESIAKRMIKYLLFARSHEIWQREIL